MLRPTYLQIFLAATLAGACGGPPFPPQTQANDARSDDPWLEGIPCAELGDATELSFEEVVTGSGRVVEKGDTVRAHYTAAGPNGEMLHDSRASGPPVEIILGSTRTICGFERGLIGMHAGGQRRVHVPWRLAFGEKGRPPDIQPRTDLVLVLEAFLPAAVVSNPGSAPVNPITRGRRR